MTSYGRSSGFAIDPIEKKPLNHFLPGTTITRHDQFIVNVLPDKA
jgi:hypothetical protein